MLLSARFHQNCPTAFGRCEYYFYGLIIRLFHGMAGNGYDGNNNILVTDLVITNTLNITIQNDTNRTN